MAGMCPKKLYHDGDAAAPILAQSYFKTVIFLVQTLFYIMFRDALISQTKKRNT
jgi:hypothetical protein